MSFRPVPYAEMRRHDLPGSGRIEVERGEMDRVVGLASWSRGGRFRVRVVGRVVWGVERGEEKPATAKVGGWTLDSGLVPCPLSPV